AHSDCQRVSRVRTNGPRRGQPRTRRRRLRSGWRVLVQLRSLQKIFRNGCKLEVQGWRETLQPAGEQNPIHWFPLIPSMTQTMIEESRQEDSSDSIEILPTYENFWS